MNTTVNDKLDPMPIGALGMWLFRASEAMFFVGLLGAFIVLDSAGGQHALFVRSSRELSNIIGLVSVILLMASSLSIRRFVSVAMTTAVLFLALQGWQWRLLLQQHNGASQNNFFGFYFLLSSVHCLHVIVGLVAVIWFVVQSRPVSEVFRRAGLTEQKSGSSEYLRDRLGHCGIPWAVQIYWHFVNAVGVVVFAALYFV